MTALSTSILFRHGKATQGYLYIKARPIKVERSRRMGCGIVADFDATGAVVGLELTAPQSFNLAAIDDVLLQLGLDEIDRLQLPSAIEWR